MVSDLTLESLVQIKGTVRARPESEIRDNGRSNKVEVAIEYIEILNKAYPQLPLNPSNEKSLPNERTRLLNRHLDLRRSEMQYRLKQRSKITHKIREYLQESGFVDIETPLLFKSTPEGAREFIVPTRVSPGLCYALPQSPQQFKQMLMAAGYDRYYQIARCFRDEDLRADRQPEFTQVDIEMSFISKDDIQMLIEGMMRGVLKVAKGLDISQDPFPTMTYNEAINTYGSDKPDTRYGLCIQEIKDLSTDKVRVEALHIPDSADVVSGADIKKIQEMCRSGPAYGESIVTTIHKYLENRGDARPTLTGTSKVSLLKKVASSTCGEFSGADPATILKKVIPGIKDNDVVIISERLRDSGGLVLGNTTLGRIRLYLANVLREAGRLDINANAYEFLWVHDFPLFTREVVDAEQSNGGKPAELEQPEDPREKQVKLSESWASTHHPFTAPTTSNINEIVNDPKKAVGKHYDLVLNGVELGGGSIRIHNPQIQKTIFNDILKLEPHVQSRFDHLISALGHGCPPHGGIALGLDRLVSIVCNTPSVRDVIAFPKSVNGFDIFNHAPALVPDAELKQYGLRVVGPESPDMSDSQLKN
ncbi:aspartate--tRNA ligase msd1 [Mycoemilia scoparia]|uniref:Aspartate--tRNA ligase msd1 n=1 Tax=Mycoemilia scoparia TaxID=417184 RepID=A0A9W8DVI1_9FUNG|nr:aspartate--tRNA ligase msd1 [Mycoemilia scoparia]